jgi:hypothetical protein
MRSYRELWLWLGAALLTLAAAFVAIALAYFTKEAHFSLYTSWQMPAALGAFILAFACFAAAILGMAFPPWVKVKFPNVYIEIYGGIQATTTRAIPNGMQLDTPIVGYKVRITNLESEQNASLTIRPFLKLEPGSAGRIGEAICTDIDWPLDPNLGLRVIEMPILLAPGTAIGGDLVYEVSRWPGSKLASPPQVRFQLMDHISDQKMNVVMKASMAKFSRKDMAPAKGGVEILGPEYEAAPVQAGDDGTTSPPEPTPRPS